MERNELNKDYIPAHGPDGLREALDNLLARANADPEFAAAQHFILYELGNQKSLIRVDTTQQPFYFWYYDLLGRPITKNVKDIIAEFLWDKCGERERYFREIAPLEKGII